MQQNVEDATADVAGAATSSSAAAAAAGHIYKCLNECGRSYTLLSSLQRHMRLECGVPKRFWCPICLRAYTRNDTLKYHMNEKHGFKRFDAADYAGDGYDCSGGGGGDGGSDFIS